MGIYLFGVFLQLIIAVWIIKKFHPYKILAFILLFFSLFSLMGVIITVIMGIVAADCSSSWWGEEWEAYWLTSIKKKKEK